MSNLRDVGLVLVVLLAVDVSDDDVVGGVVLGCGHEDVLVDGHGVDGVAAVVDVLA